MPRPARPEAAAHRDDWDAVRGPLEDRRTVLAGHLLADRSLLDDIEVVYEPARPAAELELAAVMGDEELAERAAEAERMLSTGTGGDEDPLTPETLEDVLEPFPTASDATLHEVEPLMETLLDEGSALDSADADAFEAEIAGGAWRDYVD